MANQKTIFNERLIDSIVREGIVDSDDPDLIEFAIGVTRKAVREAHNAPQKTPEFAFNYSGADLIEINFGIGEVVTLTFEFPARSENDICNQIEVRLSNFDDFDSFRNFLQRILDENSDDDVIDHCKSLCFTRNGSWRLFLELEYAGKFRTYCGSVSETEVANQPSAREFVPTYSHLPR